MLCYKLICRIFAIKLKLKTNFIKINHQIPVFILLFSVFLMLSIEGKTQLTAAFSASVTSGCSDLTVSFTDQSTGTATSWFWDFGNGQTSTERSPTFTYTTGGNFTVRLIVRNDLEEDYEEKTGYIKVFKTPKPEFTTGATSGCSPLNVQFTDNTNLTGVTLKSRTWDFGDGTTSSQQNPNHSFTGTRSFDISLRLETTDGCVGQLQKEELIHVGTKPTANFEVTPRDGCASELRQFTNKSSSNVKSWAWNFGDGTTSNESSPLQHYQDSGWFNVRLIVNNNGCRDTLNRSKYIHVKAPGGRIFVTPDCSNPFSFNFSATASANTTYNWSFGDGKTDTLRSTSNTYLSVGAYKVQLKVDDGTCYDTTSRTVFVSDLKPQASVMSAAPYCYGNRIQFGFTQYDANVAKDFRWYFGDGDSTRFSASGNATNHTYDTAGNFNPVAIFRNIYNCSDTINLSPITIVGATPKFSFPDTACTLTEVNFSDESTPSGSPIQQWVWSYGDGRFDSVQGPALNYYDFPVLYNVKLTVTDANGCVNSKTQQIQLLATPTVVAGNDTLLCLGKSAVLTATGASTYTWNTDQSVICEPCTVSPTVTPGATTNYYVTGSTPEGCSASDTVVIRVQAKERVSIQPGDTAICAGSSLQLVAAGASSGSYSWFPSDGLNNTTIANPVATPAGNISYSVSGSDSNHCFTDTATVNLVVNPAPTVDIIDSQVALPVGSTYTLQSTSSADVINWQWLPQTGLSCFDCPSPVVTLGSRLTYTLTVRNNFGCTSLDSVQMIPACIDNFVLVPNSFTPNNDGLNDYFYPNSKVPVTVKSMIIFNRWGQKVFEKANFTTNDAAYGWDGKFKNVVQNMGTYVYVMQVICVDGSIINVKGTINLLR